MVDKIILSTKDVQALIKWRDEHNDLVRKMPAPFKAIEMQFPQTKVIIKGFRDDDKLKLQVSKRGVPHGHVNYVILSNGLCVQKGNNSKLRVDEVQDCLTVYCSLMALVTYAERKEDTEVPTSSVEVIGKKVGTGNANHSKHLKKGVNVTYLLSACKNRTQIIKQTSERKKPSYAYSVRGHFRHYKSGKVVWIEQHVRCDGKKKSKIYKLGKGVE